jgi:hypothetical protein
MGNALIAPTDTLPVLIDRATQALDSARTSAEVLEARDMARVAYDAAKSASRIMRAKEAHDSLISDVHRAQAHALGIRARAEMRLAEEYDAAQERREVAKAGDNQHGQVLPSGKDLGLTHKDIHEARRMRDAERADPGVIQRTINNIVERGDEPTRAALTREVVNKPTPKPVMDPLALWLWGTLKDFEREGALARQPKSLLSAMTDPMRQDVARLAPLVRQFLQNMEN